MGSGWTKDDLAFWHEKIAQNVADSGLSCYPQEWEICSHDQMLGYMAYHGMPAHYPHWSYGKAYEKTKTMYDHGVTGLPYEMVINSDPCLAYLMGDNSLALQVLTMAHVYGHNDFFRNNLWFARGTRADQTFDQFKARADIIREFRQEVGAAKVDACVTAAHALSMNAWRNPLVRKRTHEEAREAKISAHRREWEKDNGHLAGSGKEAPYQEPDLRKRPLEPDPDLLFCIAEYNPFLEEWERVVMRIVAEEAQYFLPQIETKIMNEGWASMWHHRILSEISLTQELHHEFLVRHSQVICPHPGSINPYHLGFKVWWYLWWLTASLNAERRIDRCMIPAKITPYDPGLREKVAFRRLTEDEEERFQSLVGKDPESELLRAREAHHDRAFLDRLLSPKLMGELDLFEYAPKGENLVVSSVASDEVKRTFLRNTGMASQPVIAVEDVNRGGNRTLYLAHEHDGRDLHLPYAEKTLKHAWDLWGAPVVLKTVMQGEKVLLVYSDEGFDSKMVKEG